MKKYTLISAGISVALFATALTVSLVTNSSTNKRVEEGLADVTNKIESLKSETSQKLGGLENNLSETKAALEAAKTESSSKFEKIEGDVANLVAQDQANLATLTAAVEKVEAALATAKAELSAADAANLKTVEDRLALAEKALSDVNTALDARVVALESSSAANAEAISKLVEELAVLSEEVGKNANDSAANLNGWVEKFVGADAVETKASAISALNVTINELIEEVSDLYYDLGLENDPKRAEEIYKVVEALRDGYFKGMVTISLTVDGKDEEGNSILVKTIETINAELDAKVEPYRVEVLRRDIISMFNEYEADLLEEVEAMDISAETLVHVQDVYDKTELKEADYKDLYTSAELNAVLESFKLVVDKPYYEAKLENTKNAAEDVVVALTTLEDEAKIGEKTYVEVRVENIQKVAYAENAIKNATSREQVKELYAAAAELVAVEVQLAKNAEAENIAAEEYAEEWFNNKFLTVSARTGETYLTSTELKEAKETYEATVAKYDWKAANGRGSKALADEYKAEVKALEEAMAKYEGIYELELLKDTAKADFDARKVLIRETFDVNHTQLVRGSKETEKEFAPRFEAEYGIKYSALYNTLVNPETYAHLTAVEREAAVRMIDVVEIQDVTVMETIAEIKAEVERVDSIFANIVSLVRGEDTEAKLIAQEALTLGSYNNKFTVEELEGTVEQLDAIDSTYKYIDSIYRLTMTDASLAAQVAALNSDKISGDRKAQEAAIKDLSDKYAIVYKVRDYTTSVVDQVNSEFAGWNFVANEYGYEFRLVTGGKDFMAVPTTKTAAEVAAEAGTPDKKGNYASTTNGFVGQINAIYNEAHSLWLAFYNEYDKNDKTSFDGSLADIRAIEALEKADESGLSADHVGTYVEQIVELGDVNSLYNDIKAASSYKTVLDTYTANVDTIVATAVEHNKARALGFKYNNENEALWAKTYADLYAQRGYTDAYVVTEGKLAATDFHYSTLVVAADGTVIYYGTTNGQLPTPKDTFYHDGKFKPANGTTSGIFQFHANYDGSQKDKDGKPVTEGAGVYSVVLPQGATLISGTQEAMDDIVDRLGGDLTKNGSIEKVVIADLFDRFPNSTWANFTKEAKAVLASAKSNLLVKSTTQKTVQSSQDVFGAEFTALLKKYDDLYKVYDASVLASEKEAYLAKLEDTIKAEREADTTDAFEFKLLQLGRKYREKINNAVYSYDVAPIFNKEFFDDLEKVYRGEPTQDPTMVWGGTTSGEFKWNEKEEKFMASITLNIWNNVTFTYTDGWGEAMLLTYTDSQGHVGNTTFTGYITASNVVNADWTENLYHEVQDGVDTASIGKFYCSVKTCTYIVSYDPEAGVLEIDIA